MKRGGTTNGLRVVFFLMGGGLWKCSEINCGEGCDSVNIRKTTEIYTINRWIVCYVKYILRNLLDFFIVDFSMMEESLWREPYLFPFILTLCDLPPVSPSSPITPRLPAPPGSAVSQSLYSVLQGLLLLGTLISPPLPPQSLAWSSPLWPSGPWLSMLVFSGAKTCVIPASYYPPSLYLRKA